MFFGSMTLAYAMEHICLHRRWALLVLRYVGSSIVWCVLFFCFFLISNAFIFYVLNRSMGGLMLVTAFLSMWINNSASTNIMIPTAIAIVNELQNYHDNMEKTAASTPNDNDDHQNSTENISIKFTREKCLYLHIQRVNQLFFLFAAVLENKASSNKQSIELSSLLENVVVTQTVPMTT